MSQSLLERVNVFFEDAGCKTDPTGLSKLACEGASVAVPWRWQSWLTLLTVILEELSRQVKAGAVASALVFGEILTPEDIFRLLNLEQDARLMTASCAVTAAATMSLVR